MYDEEEIIEVDEEAEDVQLSEQVNQNPEFPTQFEDWNANTNYRITYYSNRIYDYIGENLSIPIIDLSLFEVFNLDNAPASTPITETYYTSNEGGGDTAFSGILWEYSLYDYNKGMYVTYYDYYIPPTFTIVSDVTLSPGNETHYGTSIITDPITGEQTTVTIGAKNFRVPNFTYVENVLEGDSNKNRFVAVKNKSTPTNANSYIDAYPAARTEPHVFTFPNWLFDYIDIFADPV